MVEDYKIAEEEIDEEEDVKTIERMLLTTEWVEEAEEIPLEEVGREEQLLLLKCINREEFTDEEIDKLEDVLGRFREATRKLKPKETIQNVEKNIQITEDMNTILERMEQAKQTQTLEFNYPLGDNESMKVLLLVNNEIDASTIDDLNENLGLFEDLTQDELKTYSQYSHNEKMTREEKAVARKIEEKIAKMGQTHIDDVRTTAIQFLTKQTTIATDPTCTPMQMKTFYEKMTLGPLLALFERVQGMVGLSHVDRDELFR